MVKISAVVPINALGSAKSRLARYLSEAERHELIYWMAGHVLSSIWESGQVQHVAVVSPDPEVLSWAAQQGAQALAQSGTGGLNAGLELGRDWARRNGADALLILLGDLPCLAATDVADFIDAAGVSSLALAPDREGKGTNGLLLRLAVDFPFAFGTGSLAQHHAAARERHIIPVLFQTYGLSFDVDSFAELSMLYEFGIWMPGDHDLPLAATGEISRSAH
jgi:2-phospho-L-lactate guanylyltransferase